MPDRGSTRGGALQALIRRPDVSRLLAMMGLCFLVLFVIGILRPLRSAFALSGLEVGTFYNVYFVSAIVVLGAPIYNRLADRFSWQRLIPATGAFFGLSMVAFRFLYAPEAPWYGLAFYGWYDLLAASLVTQFYMATQVFYNARDAKRAYPIVIAAGSAGATLGALTHVFLPDMIGAQNMLYVAGAVLLAFAVGIAIVWAREAPEPEAASDTEADPDLSASELGRILSHPQVRLIALTVLLTIFVKQFIDYEYNTLTREVFTDVEAIARFQGTVDGLTQWLPIVVLLSLRPILVRWGAPVAVVIFPVAILLAMGALAVAVWLGTAALAVAVGARTTEKMFRYSAERTGREILYVPVPEDIKLKAKSWIDVAVEKGLGKALSGVLIAVPPMLLGSVTVTGRLIIVGVIGLGFAFALLAVFLRVRREYVASLAHSFEGRFASFQGTFISMADSGALELARAALEDKRPLKIAFTLDLLKDGDREDIAALSPQLHDLIDHDEAEIRIATLTTLLRLPSGLDEDRARRRLRDDEASVREAAARLLAHADPRPPGVVLSELLGSDEPEVRGAALACLARDVPAEEAERIVEPRFEQLVAQRVAGDGRSSALELARAAGLVPGHPEVETVLRELMGSADAEVAAAAVASAARLPDNRLLAEVIVALAEPGTRRASRTALAQRGESVVGPLITVLNDPSSDPWVRRGVASTLGEIPTTATVDALITSYLLPETEQALDDQALISLHRLRSQDRGLDFPQDRVFRAVDREVAAAERYARTETTVSKLEDTPVLGLLARALREAHRDRREGAFRWLGLVYPEHGMRRSFVALQGVSERQRANALEWIESTVGHERFGGLAPVLGLGTAAHDDEEPVPAAEALRELWEDEDTWIAHCALWASFQSDPKGFRARLSDFVPTDPDLQRVIERIIALTDGGAPAGGFEEGERMDLIEKVFLLQNVDLLSGVTSRQLSLLASVARDLDVREGAILIRKGEPTDALYVVIHGEVSLEGMGDRGLTMADGDAFGTWAMIDDRPSLVEARATRPTRVLRILREDFRDLLVDHPELGLDLLQGLASRIHALAPS